MAPLVHTESSQDHDGFAANPIIIVISPLVTLWKIKQIDLLRKFGISAGSIGEDNALDLKIEKGECSVVFRRRSPY